MKKMILMAGSIIVMMLAGSNNALAETKSKECIRAEKAYKKGMKSAADLKKACEPAVVRQPNVRRPSGNSTPTTPATPPQPTSDINWVLWIAIAVNDLILIGAFAFWWKKKAEQREKESETLANLNDAMKELLKELKKRDII